MEEEKKKQIYRNSNASFIKLEEEEKTKQKQNILLAILSRSIKNEKEKKIEKNLLIVFLSA